MIPFLNVDFDKAIKLFKARVENMINSAPPLLNATVPVGGTSKVASHLRSKIAMSTTLGSSHSLNSLMESNIEMTGKRPSNSEIHSGLQQFDNAPANTVHNAHLYDHIYGLQEAEEQLADALFRRAQAKMLLNSHEALLQEALEDAGMVSFVNLTDDINQIKV